MPSKNSTQSSNIPLAVVGVSALFPGSIDATGFWRDILHGKDCITDIPKTQWLIDDYYDPDPKAPDKTYSKRGGFLGELDFDALKWGIPPHLMEATDTSQLLALIVAQRVLNDATNGQFANMDRSRISVILGVTSAQELLLDMTSRLQRPIWKKSLLEAGIDEEKTQDVCDRIANHYVPWQESTFPGLLGNVIAGRIANRLDLGGTNCVTDAACASALSAAAMGVSELRLGSSDLVIIGGCDTMTDIFMYMCFSKTPALSETDDCRPLSSKADGTLLGEGIGMVALKRLDDAERDGDRIYAILKGVGSSSDGRAKSVYAPSAKGQAIALRRAYENAGYAPEDVQLIEAHGTGTKAGDAAEISGLMEVFSEAKPKSCAIGSIKSQIGHTKAAAGAAGLFKTIMALHSKILPGTIKVEQPAEILATKDTPFYVNTYARPWISPERLIRRAGVSALGFGGSNFHITLEEYKGNLRAKRRRTFSTEVVIFSGKTPEQVTEKANKIANNKSTTLQWLAYQSQRDYLASDPVRLAIVASDMATLRKKIALATTQIERSSDSFSLPNGVFFGIGIHKGKTALLFPGQGSQYLNMSAGITMAYDEPMKVWEQNATHIFEKQSLNEIVFPIPTFNEEDHEKNVSHLRTTQWAQPAIGVASLAYFSLIQKLQIPFEAVAGHSYGEISAVAVAGAIEEKKLVLIAQKRGELMNKAASNPGSMLAISENEETVQQLIKNHPEVVIANINAPDQTVVAGPTSAIHAFDSQLKKQNFNAKLLNVATAFHSPIVAGCTDDFRAFLQKQDITSPDIPIYANLSALPHENSPKSIRDTLADEISNPVRFVDMIKKMLDDGITTFIEVGPSSILGKLTQRILKNETLSAAISLDRKSLDDIEAWHNAIAELVARGIDMKLPELWSDYVIPMDPATKPVPKMPIKITGANYQKPYPPLESNLKSKKTAKKTRKTKIQSKKTPLKMEQKAQKTKRVTRNTQHFTSTPKKRPATPTFTQNKTSNHNMPTKQNFSWIQALQATQAQATHAHTVYLNALSNAHTAFLELTASSFQALSGEVPVFKTRPSFQSENVQNIPIPQYQTEPVVMSEPVMQSAPVSQQVQPVSYHSSISHQTTQLPPSTPPSIFEAKVEASSEIQQDLTTTLLQVVAEKTGYPVDMLELSMTLEGDLGIDSIKRVEILSGLQDQIPSLPDIATAELASKQTLQELVDVYGSSKTTTLTPVSSNTPNLTETLLQVVAEKTGYPVDMLELSMTLEGDLGIDSIKRVEILSGLQDQIPNLPDIATAELASKQTLQELADVYKKKT